MQIGYKEATIPASQFAIPSRWAILSSMFTAGFNFLVSYLFIAMTLGRFSTFTKPLDFGLPHDWYVSAFYAWPLGIVLAWTLVTGGKYHATYAMRVRKLQYVDQNCIPLNAISSGIRIFLGMLLFILAPVNVVLVCIDHQRRTIPDFLLKTRAMVLMPDPNSSPIKNGKEE